MKVFFTSLICLFVLPLHTLHAQVSTFTVQGNLTLGTILSTEIELSSTAGPGLGHDQVSASGDLSLDGDLAIILDGYIPNPVDTFVIMIYGGVLSGTFNSISWPANMTDWSIDYGVARPGEIIIYGPQSPLPVTWLSFDGQATSNGNLLTWRTADEINNSHFEIERSGNIIDFESIGRVEAYTDFDGGSSYSFLDKNIGNNKYYYRIKQVDLDSRFDYSASIFISSKGNFDLRFFPNPTKGLVHFTEPLIDIIIYNALGQKVMQINHKASSIDLGELQNGLYIITAGGQNKLGIVSIIK